MAGSPELTALGLPDLHSRAEAPQTQAGLHRQGLLQRLSDLNGMWESEAARVLSKMTCAKLNGAAVCGGNVSLSVTHSTCIATEKSMILASFAHSLHMI